MPLETLWLETLDGNAGGVLLEIAIFAYCFCGLAMVCDCHLVQSLETFCVRWRVREDVAGATFMALGSAAPELIISSINTVQGESDLGVGAIIGSGMLAFSTLPALCVLVAGKDLLLKRRPLARDSLTYLVALACLVAFFDDGFIVMWEAAFLLALYVAYVLMVVLSPGVRSRWVQQQRRREFRARLQAAMAEGVDRARLEEMKAEYEEQTAKTSFVEKAKEQAEREKEDAQPDAMRTVKHAGPLSTSRSAPALSERLLDRDPETHLNMSVTDTNGHQDDLLSPPSATSEEFDEPSLYSLDRNDPVPAASGRVKRAWHIATWPLQTVFRLTCVDCAHDGAKAAWYPLTFIASFLWLSCFSFTISAVAQRWNETSGLPLSLFGIVLVSVGAEIPDSVQSMSVARRGYGAMALSNSCGAQVTNILLGLGLPWVLANIAGYARGVRAGFQCARDADGNVEPEGCEDAPGLDSDGMVIWRGVQVREHSDALIAGSFQFIILGTFISALLLAALVQRRRSAVLTRRKSFVLAALYPIVVLLFCLCSQLLIHPTPDPQYYAPLDDGQH